MVPRLSGLVWVGLSSQAAEEAGGFVFGAVQCDGGGAVGATQLGRLPSSFELLRRLDPLRGYGGETIDSLSPT